MPYYQIVDEFDIKSTGKFKAYAVIFINDITAERRTYHTVVKFNQTWVKFDNSTVTRVENSPLVKDTRKNRNNKTLPVMVFYHRKSNVLEINQHCSLNLQEFLGKLEILTNDYEEEISEEDEDVNIAFIYYFISN